MFTPSFVLNQEGPDGIGQSMFTPTGGNQFDVGMNRPYFDPISRQRCVTINSGKTAWNKETSQYDPVYKQVAIKDLMADGLNLPVHNATVLEKQQWIQLDKLILALLLAWRLEVRVVTAWEPPKSTATQTTRTVTRRLTQLRRAQTRK